MEEIEVVEPADYLVLWAGELQDHETAAGFEDAEHFSEALRSVLEVPDSEGYGYSVEGVVREPEVLAVAFLDADHSVQLCLVNFLAHHRQHSFR